jgi:hypothetical protein
MSTTRNIATCAGLRDFEVLAIGNFDRWQQFADA